jgi:hypothetical protein
MASRLPPAPSALSPSRSVSDAPYTHTSYVVHWLPMHLAKPLGLGLLMQISISLAKSMISHTEWGMDICQLRCSWHFAPKYLQLIVAASSDGDRSKPEYQAGAFGGISLDLHPSVKVSSRSKVIKK